jgi:nicotinate-nucleotide--dimethylbenzimidazole phosphoribosyltransferase
MTRIEETCRAIADVDLVAASSAQQLLDNKTKPRHSLGRLEELTCKLAAIHRTPKPPIPTKAIVVMAADHGIAREGVSAYPPEVTWQMLLNFARGGAAINVLARQAGARLLVVDMGVNGPDEGVAGVLSRRIARGTCNLAQGPAMTEQQAAAAVDTGITIARELASSGVDLIGIGEMGIGNTTSATALLAALTGHSVEDIVGRGTGIDDATLTRKTALIKQALALHAPKGKRPEEILAALGGFEIAGLAGVVLGAAACKVPVLLDGFIASTAALVACRLAPLAAKYLIASHQSVEVGHRVVLELLQCKPLLHFAMRLGEGTGAALTMPIVEAAVRILHEMASFESAGVTDTGR